MKILYVCANARVPVFGTGRSAIDVRGLTAALATLGHEVLILAARVGGDRPRGFAVHVLEGRTAPRGFRPDTVYEGPAPSDLTGARLARRFGVPHVLDVSGRIAAEQVRHRRRLRPAAAPGRDSGVVEADLVVASSQALERELVARGVAPERITVQPSGVDLDRFEAADPRRDALRRRLRLRTDEAVAAFMGALRTWHDAAALVKATGTLRRHGVAVRPLVLGHGPGRRAVEALAAHEAADALFTGRVPPGGVPALLAAADVGVVTYAEVEAVRSAPPALLEYLAAARPVVAPDRSEVHHCVVPAATGALYAPDEDDRLADALAEVLADRRRAEGCGIVGREHVRGHHTWLQRMRRVLALLGAPSDMALAC